MSYEFIKKFDNFDQIGVKERQRLGKLVARKAREASELMANQAPRSDINEAGYVHFDEQFRATQIATFNWGIFNDKIVNGYQLWKLLEYGTRKMSPRKTIGPVMDVIGPEFLREAGKIGS